MENRSTGVIAMKKRKKGRKGKKTKEKEASLIKNSRSPGDAFKSNHVGMFKLRTTKKWLCRLTPYSECL